MPTIIIPVFHYIRNKAARISCLRSIARSLNFSFSKEVTLLNKIIGLDSRKRKLFIIRKNNSKPVCCIIDLQDIQNCSLKKIYGNIIPGGLKRKKLEEYLTTISLNLGFKNRKEQITIRFYENTKNPVSELATLEAAAKTWQHLLSGLLNNPVEKAIY